MRVTAIVPAYNAAAWLPATLASVAAQTRAADEVLVIDDGSSDDTAAVARACGVRVISVPNAGVSAARNRGIAEASGDWIALVDADDLWREDKLERQLAALALAPDVGVASCDHYQFREDGSRHLPSLLQARADRYARVAPQPLAPGVSRLRDMGVGLIALGMALFPSTLLFRRDLALACGGFDASLRHAEDYEFLLRLLKRSDVVIVEDTLVGYRLHAASASRDDEAMAEALVEIGARIEADPARYADGAFAAFRPRLREGALHAAASALKRKDLDKARRLLGVAGGIRRDRQWLRLAVASRMPATIIDALLALKRRSRGA